MTAKHPVELPQRDLEEHVIRFVVAYSMPVFGALLLTLIGLLVILSWSFEWIMLAWFVAVGALLKLSQYQRVALLAPTLSHASKLRRATLLNVVDALSISTVLLFMQPSEALLNTLLVFALLLSSTISILASAGYLRLFLAFNVTLLLAISVACAKLVVFNSGAPQLLLLVPLALLTFYIQFHLSSAVFNIIRAAKQSNSRNAEINLELKLQVNQARKANESKTRFLASASHDLRQPISVLSLSVLSLQMLTKDKQQSEIVTNMDAAIQNIDAQLSSLLDISKLDAGIVEVDLRVVDLLPLIKSLVQPYVDDSCDQVAISVTSSLKSARVRTDPQLLARVINNLLSNALKYTQSGKIEVILSRATDLLFINVVDTGVGISAQHLSKVFDEFYQVGNTQRDSNKGLGLGLSIVHRLCALLDIKLSIRSQVDTGTAVTLSLPESNAVLENLLPDHHGSAHARSLNVLVLDNEQSILTALEGLLVGMGHAVTCCDEAADALHKFMRDNFDLALIDYRLPGDLTGVDVIAQIKKVSPSMPCFLVTGDNSIDAKDLDVQIVYKPITREKLKVMFAQ